MTDDPPTASAQWHERTVERSLKNARERAISRGDRFITAAAELLRTTGKSDFTVQEVVDRSGMSLRSFYHHFATKDDLLLALIEESVRRYTQWLQPQLDATEGAVAKLELLLDASFRDRHNDHPASRGMVLFHWHLAESRTDEFVATLQPQLDLISSILQEGVAEGSFRADLPIAVQASLVTHTLLSLLDMRVLGVDLADGELTSAALVEWCLTAVGARAPGASAFPARPVSSAATDGTTPPER
jgi:AcrR family transcriptional regulator